MDFDTFLKSLLFICDRIQAIKERQGVEPIEKSDAMKDMVEDFLLPLHS
jgi:hypothetical protein